MTRNIKKYESFFDFIRRGHFIKARDFQKENNRAIEEVSETREGKEYFSSLPTKTKGKYLIYLVNYQDKR